MPYTLYTYSVHYRNGNIHNDTDLEYLNQYIRRRGIRRIAYILIRLEEVDDGDMIVIRLEHEGPLFHISVETSDLTIEDIQPVLWEILGNHGNLDVRLRDRIRLP